MHTVYIEPFFGGGAIFFGKQNPIVPGDQYREVINDKDDIIINLYRVYKTKPDELIQKIESTLYSQSDYKRSKIILKSNEGSDIDIAWALIVQSFFCFGTVIGSGFAYGCVGRNHVTVWDNYKLRIKDYIGRLEKTFITCEDAIKVLERFNSPQSFAYLDPPYPETYQSYENKYSIEDLNQLIEFLDEKWVGSFLLSCYENKHPALDKWEKFEFNARMSVARADMDVDRKRKEVVWRRLNNEPVRPDIAMIYKSDAFSHYYNWTGQGYLF
jgi:DNA adenine methylase